MEYINYIVGIIGVIIAIVTFLSEKLPFNSKLKIILATLTITIGLIVFNSDAYKHYKHFDESKFCVVSKQFPHVLKRGNQFYYKHFLAIHNCYLENLKIENISVKLNSKSPIKSYEILLTDLNEDTININIENYNNLSVDIDELNKGEFVLLSFSSQSFLKEPTQDNIRMWMSANTIYAEYTFLSKNHKKSVFAGVQGKFPNRVYFKDAVIFEKVIALDHRKLPNLFAEYQYHQFLLDNDSTMIKVFCDSEKFIHIYFSGNGTLEYKSDRRISNPFDMVRLLVFKDGFFISEQTFDKHKIEKK